MAGALLARSRLNGGSDAARTLETIALVIGAAALCVHAYTLWSQIFSGGNLRLGIGAVTSLIGLEIALIAIVAGLREQFRGLTALLLLVAAIPGAMMLSGGNEVPATALSMPIKLHAASSLIAYSLLAVGAVLAVGALVQERRLRAAKTGGWVSLLPPLAETERLVYAIAAAGFVGLLISIATGIVFVNDMFAQHLVHKSLLSIAAAIVFGALIVGRIVAGWRGKSALLLYLGGFAILLLAYFGSRIVLEQILGRQWG